MKLPPARITTLIAAITVASYVLLSVSGYDEAAELAGGFIPARLSGIPVTGALPVWLTPLTATLLHGGWLHLGFNMLMLVFCGQMVEAALGGRGLAILYLIGAYAAAGLQYAAGPLDLSPMIGASGAISAVFGAYALLFSQPRLFLDRPVLARVVNILWLALAWVGLQYLMGLATSAADFAVATPAHVGGFFAGLLLARPLLRWRHRKA